VRHAPQRAHVRGIDAMFEGPLIAERRAATTQSCGPFLARPPRTVFGFADSDTLNTLANAMFVWIRR